MAAPEPLGRRRVPNTQRPIVMAIAIGGGVSLFAVVVGLILLGLSSNGDEQISSTGLASIGATLAGAFAAWMGRRGEETPQRNRRHDDPQR